MANQETPFADLPAALVEEVLGQTSAIGDLLLETFRRVKTDRSGHRQALLDRGLIVDESALGFPPLPTTCGADGSYAIDRLLTVDLVAAAAVAVEGLTPPSEKRHWEQPRHSTFVAAEVHYAETATILRAVMLGNELLLATRAPHDLVMIDGTFTLPIIYFNQALNQAPDCPDLRCSWIVAAGTWKRIGTSCGRRGPTRTTSPCPSTRRAVRSGVRWDGRGNTTTAVC